MTAVLIGYIVGVIVNLFIIKYFLGDVDDDDAKLLIASFALVWPLFWVIIIGINVVAWITKKL